MDLRLAHDLALNPDGSGRASLRWEGPGEGAPPAGQFLLAELDQAKGVDAWEKVSLKDEGGRRIFEAVAYFPSLADVRFHCQGFHVNLMDFTTATEDGTFRVENLAQGGPGSAPRPGLKGKALAAAIEEERGKLRQARGLIEGMFGGLRCSVVLHLPGKVGEIRNAKKESPNSVSAGYAGRDLIAVVDRLLEDDALAKQVVELGGASPETIALLLGDKGPLRVSTKGPLAPIFDYAAEVERARAGYDELRASLGLSKPPARGPSAGGVRVLGVKIVREADGERDITPLGQNYPGMNVAVAADLPGPALSVSEGALEAVVTDAGVDLTPDDDWKRRIHFPKLSKDGRTAWFDLEFTLPPEGTAGFREIRGVVRCRVSEGSEDVDLGFKKLAAGTKGKAMDAVLVRLDAIDEERSELELQLKVPREQVESLSLVRKGESTVLEQRGYSASGDECSLTYEMPGAPAPGDRLVIRAATGLRDVDVPFQVGDVDLIGRPRA